MNGFLEFIASALRQVSVNMKYVGQVEGMLKFVQRCIALLNLNSIYLFFEAGKSEKEIMYTLLDDLEEAKSAYLETDDISPLAQAAHACVAYLLLTSNVRILFLLIR